MTLTRAVAAFGRVLLLLVLVASGVYVLLYLARWEWQRAQIAGIFFLSSLVVLSTTLVLRRLTALERRVAMSGPVSGPVGSPQGGPGPPGVEPLHPFPWLGSGEPTHVFLPVLLGFGVALSLLAALAERVVSFSLGDASLIGREVSDPRLRRRTRLLAAGLAALLLAALAGTVLVREELMTRAVPVEPGTRTYLVEVEARRVAADPVTSVEVLADYCVSRAHVPSLVVDAVEPAGPGTARLVVHPVLGPFDQARFDGCLNDAVLDRRTTEITSVETRYATVTEADSTGT